MPAEFADIDPHRADHLGFTSRPGNLLFLKDCKYPLYLPGEDAMQHLESSNFQPTVEFIERHKTQLAMKTASQDYIFLPSFANAKVRVCGDLLSVYDLMRALEIKHFPRVLDRVIASRPLAAKMVTKTLFICNTEETKVVDIKDWFLLGHYIQEIAPRVSMKRLNDLNDDLGIIPVNETTQVLPSTTDATVTDYGTKAIAPEKSQPEIADGKMIFPDLDGAKIRSDGKLFSVHDFIRVVGGQKNPREVWKRLCTKYSALVTLCDEYKFPGTTGGAARKTPATDKKGLLEISQLLPGEFGNKFRKEAADIILAYIEGDVKLAEKVVDRALQQGKDEDVEWHAQRTSGKVARKKLTGIAAAHGLTGGEAYRRLTSLIYKSLTGKTATQLRKELDIPRNKIIRDYFGAEWLIALNFLELAVAKALKKHDARGNEEILLVTEVIAGKVMKFVE